MMRPFIATILLVSAPLALASVGPYVEEGLLNDGLQSHEDRHYDLDLFAGESVIVVLETDDAFGMPEVRLIPPSMRRQACEDFCVDTVLLTPRIGCEGFIADHGPTHPLGGYSGTFEAGETGAHHLSIASTSRGSVRYQLTVTVGEDGGADRVHRFVVRGQHVPFVGPYGFCDLT